MAARSKYTPEVVKRLADAITLGATYELACAYAGIRYETFRVWQRTKPGFSATVEEAEGKGAVQLLGKIRQSANDGDWRAAAWVLEHRHPEQYGRLVVETYHRDVVDRIAREEGVDPARLYDLAFEREKRRAG